MGGLGNQMFQISHAISQGLKHNLKPIFSPESFTPLQGKKPKTYLENIFRNIPFSTEKISFNTVDEKSFNFNQLYPTDQNTIFHGYFQSSKNFLGFDSHIKNIFSPPENFVDQIIKKYDFDPHKKNVSVHIRMGDYLKFPKIHPTVTKEYVDKILKKLDFDSVYFFGDDKFFLKSNFSNFNIIEEEDWYELWFMSLCRTNIMSNSTFSWWGSFLNKHVDKKVYAPSIWFGPQGNRDYQDIYEQDWIKVECEFKDGKLF